MSGENRKTPEEIIENLKSRISDIRQISYGNQFDKKEMDEKLIECTKDVQRLESLILV